MRATKGTGVRERFRTARNSLDRLEKAASLARRTLCLVEASGIANEADDQAAVEDLGRQLGKLTQLLGETAAALEGVAAGVRGQILQAVGE